MSQWNSFLFIGPLTFFFSKIIKMNNQIWLTLSRRLCHLRSIWILKWWLKMKWAKSRQLASEWLENLFSISNSFRDIETRIKQSTKKKIYSVTSSYSTLKRDIDKGKNGNLYSFYKYTTNPYKKKRKRFENYELRKREELDWKEMKRFHRNQFLWSVKNLKSKTRKFSINIHALQINLMIIKSDKTCYWW
jgi:hypothetical protein